MKKNLTIITFLTLLVMSSCNNYNRIMRKKVVGLLGRDYKSYKAFSYPTNNFGLVTSYDRRAKDINFICDTWNCLNLDGELPTEPAQLLDINGFAAFGGNGGTITLSEKEKQTLALKAVLPKIYEVIGASASYNQNRIVNVDLQMGQAIPRKLRRTKIIPFISSLPNDNILKQSFNRGDLVLVVSDVIIKNMTVNISVDNEMSAALDAKLTSSVQNFGDTELKVQGSKTTNGKYSFNITQPVIILRLTKRQPGAGVLEAADDNFDNWIDVPVKNNLKKEKK